MTVTLKSFTLAIRADGEGPGFRLEVSSPEGEASEIITPPAELCPGDLDLFGEAPSAPEEGSSQTRQVREIAATAPRPRPRDLGDSLFRTFFPGPVRQLFDRTWGAAEGASHGVRILLRFDTTDPRVVALSRLPWELLYRSETRDFLGRDRLSSIVRYLEVQRPNRLPPFEPPLSILLVAASPKEREPLGLVEERRRIEDRLCSSGDARVEVLERASIARLDEVLASHRFDVVHFMGHGDFDAESAEGYLLLEGEDGRPATLSGEVFAEALKGRLPRLVVVNACETARSGPLASQDLFAGVATALVLGGVPAVVAMRAPVSDRAAISFSSTLYRELAGGEPVDAAVAEARRSIFLSSPETAEWATPVVFLRAADGRIFQAPHPDSQEHETPVGASTPAVSEPGASFVNDIQIGELVADSTTLGNEIGQTSPGQARPGSLRFKADRINSKRFEAFNRKASEKGGADR